MDAMPQVPLGRNSLFLNPDRRCHLALLLDTSYSMDGPKLQQLQNGVAALIKDVSSDFVALKRLECAVITYGPVKVIQPFTTFDYLSLPTLQAGSDTPMGEAIMTAVQLLADRKAECRKAGVPYFKSWIFNVTDGAPTDDVSAARRAIQQGEANNQFAHYAVGVDTADMNELKRLSVRPPLHLKGLAFDKMFEWVSASLRSISRSTPGQSVPLSNPVAPNGWADATS